MAALAGTSCSAAQVRSSSSFCLFSHFSLTPTARVSFQSGLRKIIPRTVLRNSAASERTLIRKCMSFSIRAEDGTGEDVADTNSSLPSKKKSRSLVLLPRKQRVVLRFLWLEKNIGISLDQIIPGHGTIPLCPYFFWPRKDAWEELKAKLDSKKWISRKRTIILLNQATDIINLWQQNATNSL